MILYLYEFYFSYPYRTRKSTKYSINRSPHYTPFNWEARRYYHTTSLKDISQRCKYHYKKDLFIYRSDPFGFFQQPVWSIERQVWGGTWLFIDEDGSIITNKHVIADTGAIYTVISSTGKEYDAKVVATDPINDLAVIKIESETKYPVPKFIKDITDIKVWQFVIATGNALGKFQNSVSLGIISGKERTIEAGWERLSGLLQTDAAINPGNSWGPLINLSWEVMGINTAIINNSEWIGFAITLTEEKKDYILKSIQQSGSIKRPFIGISYIQNSPWIQEKLWLAVDYWAYVIDEAGSVIAWSSAEKVGIEPWDIILKVNESTITLQKELGSFIQNKIPWEILVLKILKKSGEEKIVELELWEY